MAVLSAAAKWQPFLDPPQVCDVDDVDYQPKERWVDQLLQCKSSAFAFWPNYRKQLGITKRSDLVTIGVPEEIMSPQSTLSRLEPLPFEICALGAVFFDEWIAADYRRWGFSRSHISHGWGCAFRGAGHDRLVSRRWLDFGPWRVLRLPKDTTFIQFHDLAITDPAEAYEQAKAGHERMGNSAIGGYIQWHIDSLLEHAGQGLYSPDEKLLRVVVGFGNEVKQSEMLCNAALRLHHRTAPSSTPVERVAYVFVDEPDARAHLHELWLRELECWVADDKGLRRLDLDYHPVPDPPAWVKRLDGG
ncbi:MAG: hypothetical protein HC863_01680 [Myxococcales bacterium]|nr:hypothetical protein [Myxococcales bacterium]